MLMVMLIDVAFFFYYYTKLLVPVIYINCLYLTHIYDFYLLCCQIILLAVLIIIFFASPVTLEQTLFSYCYFVPAWFLYSLICRYISSNAISYLTATRNYLFFPTCWNIMSAGTDSKFLAPICTFGDRRIRSLTVNPLPYDLLINYHP